MRNVFTLSRRPAYYFRHPIEWIREVWHNLCAAHRRIKYGWSYEDAYNLFDWFLDVMPPMLRALGDGRTYPEYKFDSAEKWQDWLNQQADLLEHCKEDGIKNEYADTFHEMCNKATERAAIPGGEEFDVIRHKFLDREKEIAVEQHKILNEVFAGLADNFYDLWD